MRITLCGIGFGIGFLALWHDILGSARPNARTEQQPWLAGKRDTFFARRSRFTPTLGR